jgi:hypothetical protein
MIAPGVAPESQALIILITPPTGRTSSEHSDVLCKSILPLHDAIHAVTVRIADIQLARRRAEAAEEDPYISSFFERIKQTCDAMTREASAAASALDSLAGTALQLDSYALDMLRSLSTRVEREAEEERRKAGFVTITKAEHDRLLGAITPHSTVG